MLRKFMILNTRIHQWSNQNVIQPWGSSEPNWERPGNMGDFSPNKMPWNQKVGGEYEKLLYARKIEPAMHSSVNRRSTWLRCRYKWRLEIIIHKQKGGFFFPSNRTEMIRGFIQLLHKLGYEFLTQVRWSGRTVLSSAAQIPRLVVPQVVRW